jgi:hypothetical protein
MSHSAENLKTPRTIAQMTKTLVIKAARCLHPRNSSFVHSDLIPPSGFGFLVSTTGG